MTDNEAITGCLNGDRNSFKWIVERYKYRAYHSALVFIKKEIFHLTTPPISFII